MKIITLVENTPGNPACRYEHGLSLYIETEKHCLLLDAGQSDAVLANAQVLGIDLDSVDTLILSHGHYDHSGGILPFAQRNAHAAIIMQRAAAGHYYHGERYIGIDPQITKLPQVRLIEGDVRLDEELFLFSGITGRRHWPRSNLVLSELREGEMRQDEFRHEQCLVITQGKRHYLLSGCAHNGILNILDRYQELFGAMPEVVISGFHMRKKGAYTPEETEVIQATARELRKTDTVFYTGHCTGQEAFELMKPIMGEQLRALHSGCVICR